MIAGFPNPANDRICVEWHRLFLVAGRVVLQL